MTDTIPTITPTDLDLARARELLGDRGGFAPNAIERVASALAREREQGARPPLPIRIHCPECGKLHVDDGEWMTRSHHTHSCQACGATWRPAVAPTVGVQFLPGFRNAESPPRQARWGSGPLSGSQFAPSHEPMGPDRVEFTLRAPAPEGTSDVDASNLAEDLARDDESQPPAGDELAQLRAKAAWADALYEDLRRIDHRVTYNGLRENIGAYVKERFEVVMAEHPALREIIETLRARCREAEAERNELREKVASIAEPPAA